VSLGVAASIPIEFSTFFKFVDLPLELRREIYIIAINAEYGRNEVPVSSKCRPTTPLSLVNGQIHDEVRLPL
jgi:hypothetical protein